MYCHQCGSKLPYKAKFCAKCGKALEKIELENNDSSKTEQQLPQAKDHQDNQNKKDSTGVAVFLGFLAIVAVGFFVLWISGVFGGTDTTSNANIRASTTTSFQINTDNSGTTTQTKSQDIPAQQTQTHTNLSAPQSPPTTKSLSDIVEEWRESTAYVDCTFGNLPNNNYEEQWGSGLLVLLNSIPTVITNRHVVDNGKNDLDYCDIKFPETINAVGYQIYQNGQQIDKQDGAQDISYDSNGNDVAYLTMPQSQISVSKFKDWDNYSLDQRSKSGSFNCTNKLNIGDPIVILGYPIYGSVSDSNYYSGAIEVTATEGIISGMDGVFYTTSAKIEHGNSGGLAIDETNDCYFGIPTWNESGSFESLGRILPSSVFLQ